MRKFYYFICTLFCIMGGVNSANAQETTDLSLELSAKSATQRDMGGNESITKNLPTERAVKYYFTGDNAIISKTGMVWGTGQDKGSDFSGDFKDASAGGFAFRGRPMIGGEYVAQMYTVVDQIKSLDVSFKSSNAAISFSIWKINEGGEVSNLASMDGGFTSEEANTFQSSNEDKTASILEYGDRLLLIWNCMNIAGNTEIVISEFTATAHCVPNTAVNVTVKAKEVGAEESAFEHVLRLPVGESININSLLPTSDFIEFEQKNVTVGADLTEVEVSYTGSVPFATSYEGLTTGNKWVSFITHNNRMHVYDDNSKGNNYTLVTDEEADNYGEYINNGTVKKYPTIDRATFANLSDRKFWGFVCENPLTSSNVKIYNKGEGTQKTLYLTKNGDDSPVLYKDENGNVPASWITDEWILEKGNTEGDIQYFCLRANGTGQRINNNGNMGYMTTWSGGGTTGDYAKGSNIRFVNEQDTYDIMKERALTAPSNAINSLTAEARAAITGSTVSEYQAAITAIQDMENAGVIPFVEGGYYYLRNYTPVDGKTYVLDSKNGTSATTDEVSAGLANSADMDYSNINAIWKITTDPNHPAVDLGSQDIGVSKTIGRFVTHVNSSKKLAGVSNSPALNDAGATYYFVNLGAGQHFLKNQQYKGTGQQASATNLSCGDNGSLGTQAIGDQKKNTRSTWYGIPVTSIKVTITDAGYATICLPFGVTLPEDENATLEAYAVTAAGDGVATLTPVTSIPANKGVILKGTANKSYTLTIDDKAAWEEGFTNLLSGSCMAEKVKADAYVLSKQENVVGLYKAVKNQTVDSTDDSWLNNDNKAYLLVENVTNTEGNARFLSFDFGTETGLDVIKGTEPASSESVVYDLSGRRVRTAQKGLYIVNGKKVVK